MNPVFFTADLYDAHGEACRSCQTQFRQYGGRRFFSGQIRTVQCRDDNVLLRRALESRANGDVLVVDGGASLASALLGDVIAGLGAKNGWSGVIVLGAVRDTVALGKIDLGIKALGSNPRKSAKAGAGATGVEVSSLAASRLFPATGSTAMTTASSSRRRSFCVAGSERRNGQADQ